jgi:hypothetical protein
VCLAVDEKEAVLCGTDGGGLGRVHDLQLTGLPALQVHVHAQRVEYKKKLAPMRRNRMKTKLPEYISRQVPFISKIHSTQKLEANNFSSWSYAATYLLTPLHRTRRKQYRYYMYEMPMVCIVEAGEGR